MTRGPLDPLLARALVLAARKAASAAEPWWIVGSAAAALHGVTLAVADLDLLMAPGDAARLLGQVGSAAEADGGTGPFRSEVFGRWTGGPLPVDVMGGLRVFADGRWAEVRPVTREAVDLEGATVFLPSAAELAAIMRRFGRPKDLARARLLDALASG